jgi:uncharacterized coiled-coil protein SlyX
MEELNTLSNHTVEMPYDPALVDNIRRVLELQAQSVRPQSFEIYVDGLRVVDRTINVEKFDLHKSFVLPNTKRVIITVFKGIRTPNCTCYIFIKNQDTKENLGSIPYAVPAGYLSGVEVKQMIEENNVKQALNHKVERLEEKLQDKERIVAERDKQLREADDYITKLQNGIELLKNEMADKKSAIYTTLIDLAKNPPVWVQMWLGKTANIAPKQLAGMQTQENDSTEVVDLRSQPESLSEEDKRHLTVIRRMEEELEDNELHLLMLVNDKLIEKPELMPDVADLIGVTPPENT